MPTQIRVWEIEGGKIVPRDSAVFSDSHREDELEEWIAQSPDILGEKLLIISRQLNIGTVGRLDLLGMDENGKLVIIELKRGLAPREAVAQGLDYASWLCSASEEEVLAHANQYLQEQSGDADRDLPQAFREKFKINLPEWICESHKIVLVATGLDSSAERIINYLARQSVQINAVFFNYVDLGDGRQLLVRSVLVPDTMIPTAAGGKSRDRVSESELMAMAQERKTTGLVEICRGMGTPWEEQYASTAGGSFRYWVENRMVFGVNVSGQLDPSCPNGEVDVWVRTDKLAAAIGISEETLKERLSGFKPFEAGRMPFVIRLKRPEDAELLVKELTEVAAVRRARAVG